MSSSYGREGKSREQPVSRLMGLGCRLEVWENVISCQLLSVTAGKPASQREHQNKHPGTITIREDADQGTVMENLLREEGFLKALNQNK